MRKTENYSLKNASLLFKLAATAVLLGSIALLGWSWYVSLSVLKFNRPSEMCRLLGDDLWALAHYKKGLFWTLLFFQSIAYGGLYMTSRVLFARSALRRRMKKLLQAVATALLVVNLLTWFSAPFFRFAQAIAGYVGLASAIAMIALTLPPLFQLWFYKRWNSSRPVSVVIVGGGFAGIYTALGLDKALGYHKHLDITLIDRKNFFLFPPLLPSASVGTIETRQVTQSYRRIFETTNIQYKKATVTSIDPVAKAVKMHIHLGKEDMATEPGAADVSLPYDYLILAPGAVNQTFGTKGAQENAFFVKELDDAIKIRDQIIDCFERAAVVQDDRIRRELLRFAVVGGGPTGVEIATEIQDLIHEVLVKRYPEIHKDHPEVHIIQSGPQVLPGWPEKVVSATTKQLARLGIKLILNDRVVEVRSNAVILKDGPAVAARTILWCAGVKPSPLLAACGLPLDKFGKIPVDDYLRPAGFENIFVLGDSALCIESKTGKPFPPLGQVAFQQGDHMAANLAHLLRGEPIKPFKYFNYGALVSVGERYAAVDLLGIKLTGFIGWFVWRTLYLGKMIGLSTKIRIMVDWTLDLVIERSIAQLEDLSQDDEVHSDQSKELATTLR